MRCSGWLTRGGGRLFIAAAFVCRGLGTCDVRLAMAQGGGSRDLLKGVDLDGQLRRFGEKAETKAIVVAFLSTQCPISNSYLPALNELSSTYRRRGVEVYGVVSDPSVTRAEAIEHSTQYRIRFPVLFDGSGELRLALMPTHTPQAFVLSKSNRKLYSGAIDDRYVKLGVKQEAAKRSFLEDAIKAAIAGERIAVPKTNPIGCLLEDPPNKVKSGSVTFTRDIAPIIQANCSACHRPNQSGPFPLLTYDDVSAHANQILDVTGSRFMPPWKPAPGFTRFLDEQRLTEHELSLLDVWVATGKPEGDPADLPAAPAHVEGWQLGEPDVILQMQEVFAVPASGPDIRQYFVIPTHLTEDRLISAIDFHPGTPQAIHHASFFLDTQGAGRKLDEADACARIRRFRGTQVSIPGHAEQLVPRNEPASLTRWHGETGTARLRHRRRDPLCQHGETRTRPLEDRTLLCSSGGPTGCGGNSNREQTN